MRTETTHCGTFLLVCGLIVGVHSQSALGQTPGTSFGLGAAKIPDAAKSEDRTQGLRFGRSVFHAGLALELGWDSNVFYSSQNAKGSAYLRLTPQLSLGTQKTGEDKLPFVTYLLSAGMDYIGYLQNITTNENARHQFGATAGAGVVINPEGILRFSLVEQFTRTNEPRAGVEFGYNRDYNSLGFDFTWNPHKGFITLLFGYRFILDYFEDPDSTGANDLAAFNALRHELKTKVTWRYFPKTVFWGEIITGYNDYIKDFNYSGLGTLEAGNRSSVPLRVMVGSTGQLTPFLVADAGIGYRAFFFTDKLESHFPGTSWVEDIHHDVAAHVSTTWQITPAAKLRVGYQHDSFDSIVGDYYKADSIHLAAMAWFFERRLELSVGFAWTLVRYRGLFYADTTGGACHDVNAVGLDNTVSSCKRMDNYLITNVNATYYFKNWLSVGLGYQLLADISDFNVTYTGTGAPVVQQPTFSKHRVFALVQVYY